MLLSASVFVVVFVDTFVTVEVRRGEVVNANAVGHIDAATMATISMSIIFGSTKCISLNAGCWLLVRCRLARVAILYLST